MRLYFRDMEPTVGRVLAFCPMRIYCAELEGHATALHRRSDRHRGNSAAQGKGRVVDELDVPIAGWIWIRRRNLVLRQRFDT